MPVAVDAKMLIGAVNALKGITSRVQTIPILACQLWRAKDGVLTVEGTDLSLHGSLTVPCRGEGAWCLNLDRASAFIGAIRDGEVTISSDGDVAGLRCGRVKARIPSLPQADWPSFPASRPETNWITVDAQILSDRLKRVSVAVGDDPSRPYLGGVHIYERQGLSLEAADGNRAHVTSLPLDGELHRLDIIAPTAAFGFLADGEVRLAVKDGLLWIEQDARLFTSRLVDGTFPSIEQVVPKPAACTGERLTADKESLAGAVNSAEKMLGAAIKGRAILIEVIDSAGRVVAKDGTGNSIEVPFECDGDSQMRILANQRYISAVLAAVEGESVAVRSTGSISIWRGSGETFGLISHLRDHIYAQYAAPQEAAA